MARIVRTVRTAARNLATVALTIFGLAATGGGDFPRL